MSLRPDRLDDVLSGLDPFSLSRSGPPVQRPQAAMIAPCPMAKTQGLEGTADSTTVSCAASIGGPSVHSLTATTWSVPQSSAGREVKQAPRYPIGDARYRHLQPLYLTLPSAGNRVTTMRRARPRKNRSEPRLLVEGGDQPADSSGRGDTSFPHSRGRGPTLCACDWLQLPVPPKPHGSQTLQCNLES